MRYLCLLPLILFTAACGHMPTSEIRAQENVTTITIIAEVGSNIIVDGVHRGTISESGKMQIALAPGIHTFSANGIRIERLLEDGVSMTLTF